MTHTANRADSESNTQRIVHSYSNTATQTQRTTHTQRIGESHTANSPAQYSNTQPEHKIQTQTIQTHSHGTVFKHTTFKHTTMNQTVRTLSADPQRSKKPDRHIKQCLRVFKHTATTQYSSMHSAHSDQAFSAQLSRSNATHPLVPDLFLDQRRTVSCT